jgi:hypothetical protein
MCHSVTLKLRVRNEPHESGVVAALYQVTVPPLADLYLAAHPSHTTDANRPSFREASHQKDHYHEHTPVNCPHET